MSGPSSVSKEKVFNRRPPQPGNRDHKNQESVVLLNGLPLKATYLANCRLCLSDQLGQNSVNVMDEQLSIMMNHVFRFPVTFQKALPMTVCTKCYKGVELFYRYTYQVLANQKTLEEALMPDQNLKQSQINNAVPPHVPHRDTNQGKMVTIVSDVEKDDNFIEVDMQCEPADEEDNRDPFPQSSNFETHFVAVPDAADIYYDMEIHGFECIRKPNTKPVEDAPFVIEIISASEDENEMNAEDEIVTKRNCNRRAHSQQKRNPAPKVVAKAKHITTLNKPKNSKTGRITLAAFASSANFAMDEDISSTNRTTNKRPSRHNTAKQQHASKPEKRFTRQSFS